MTREWRQAVRAALAAAPLLLVVLFVLNNRVPVPLKALPVGLAALAVIRPAWALLALAIIGPLSPLVAELLGVPPPFRAIEAFAFAVLGGWLLSGPGAERRDTPDRVAARVLGLTAIASLVALTVQFVRTRPGALDDLVSRQLSMHWWSADPIGFAVTGHVLLFVGLYLAATELVRADSALRRRLAVAVTLSGAMAAVLSVLLANGIGTPAMVAWQQKFAIERVAGHIVDVNAAGSHFVLVAGLAAGLAAGARGIGRAGWGAAAVLSLVGLALTGSRTAYAAGAVIAVCGGWAIVTSRLTPARRWVSYAGVAVIVAGAAAAVLVGSTLSGADIRSQFNDTSLRMIAAEPLFGIGVGQYFRQSILALTPELAWLYAAENAHNYFLQLTAELGLFGAAAFAVLLAVPLRAALAALRGPERYLAAGVLAGATAFLLTCLTGHPLLVLEVAVPFWIVLALAGSGTVAEPRGAPPAWFRRSIAVPALAAFVLAASLPFRTDLVDVSLATPLDGVGPAAVDESGERYRPVKEYFTVYVEPTATRIRIPFRVASSHVGRSLTVADQIPAWAQHRTDIGSEWTMLELSLPGAFELLPKQRINFRVYEAGGRPEDPEGTGVWMGEATVVARHP